jgi:hypothetical protein
MSGGDYTKVVDAINEAAPDGLKGNDRFIGNCLYKLATEYCTDVSVDIKLREAFQEFLFDNYRVNGILDCFTDISTFTEQEDII